jgi:hypothetical protein
MIWAWLWRILYMGLGALAVVGLARQLGKWPAVEVWAAIMAVCIAVVSVLLRTSQTGRITWKNRLAGVFLHFGYLVGRGQLLPIAVFSWIGWVALAVIVVLLLDRPVPPPADSGITLSEGWQSTVTVLLYASWGVLVSAIFYLFGTLMRNFQPPRREGRSLLLVIGVLVLLLAGSVTLWIAGRPVLGLIVAGVPILLVAGGYGMLVLIFVTAGKNARWN